MAINGFGLAVLAGGGVLVYAGFLGVSPLAALRQVSTGKPTRIADAETPIAAPAVSSSAAYATGDSLRAEVVAASKSFIFDTYSQARRTQSGYSDCSSFVDKCLHAAGIKPPGDTWASTANFRMSPDWPRIDQSAVLPGDIGLSSEHMILITEAGATMAIGQETTGVNVKVGTPKQLFGGQKFWYCTYRGYEV